MRIKKLKTHIKREFNFISTNKDIVMGDKNEINEN